MKIHLIDYLLTFMLSRRATVCVPSKRSQFPCTLDIVNAATRETWLDQHGAMLLRENYRSVNHRYSEDTEASAYRWKEHKGVYTADKLALAVQVLKSCSNFDYQACETDDYEQSDAAHMIRSIRAEAIRSLPGYDAAAWGAPERPATGPQSIMVMMAGRN